MRAPDREPPVRRVGRTALLVAVLSGLGAPLGAASAEACFADVAVPPEWRTERVEVESRAASARFDIEPARFGPRTRRVRVRDGADVLTAVQPVLTSETHRRETSPATTRWVRGGLDGERPMSAGDRIDLVAAGIDVDALPPGTCLVERFREPRVTFTEERVLLSEASEQLSANAPVFETIRRPVTLRPAHSRLIEVPTIWDAEGRQVERPAMITRVREPAVRESVEVTRLVTDGVASREPVPAEWGTIEIPQVAAPGGYVWTVEGEEGAEGGDAGEGDEPTLAAAASGESAARDGGADATADDEADDGVEGGKDGASRAGRDDGPTPTGRRLCHREVPAEAIEYERVVVREEGRFERERIEEEHLELDVQALLEDARGERVEIPAVLELVERRVPIGEARVERREVVCEADLDRRGVARLQRALAKAGFSPGGIDGRLGPATRGAVQRFQAARDLATGALTIETVEALGIAP